VGELIAVPVTSERKAVVALATLRRLEAEYQVNRRTESGPPGPPGGRPRAWLRGALRGVRAGLGAAPVGAALVLALAGVCAGILTQLPWTTVAVGRAEGALCGVAVGLALGAAVGPARRWRATRGDADGVTGAGTADAGDVSWLVSYVTLERDRAGSGRLRASVVRINLPEAAEGRVRTILERAAAASAR
jgi:hypothetical protein